MTEKMMEQVPCRIGLLRLSPDETSNSYLCTDTRGAIRALGSSDPFSLLPEGVSLLTVRMIPSSPGSSSIIFESTEKASRSQHGLNAGQYPFNGPHIGIPTPFFCFPGTADAAGMSMEHAEMRGSFLCMDGNVLSLRVKEEGEEFRRSATFYFVPLDLGVTGLVLQYTSAYSTLFTTPSVPVPDVASAERALTSQLQRFGTPTSLDAVRRTAEQIVSHPSVSSPPFTFRRGDVNLSVRVFAARDPLNPTFATFRMVACESKMIATPKKRTE